MCLVYKCRNGLVPQYLAETFSNVSDNPVIRNATSLNIFKTAYLKSHFNH